MDDAATASPARDAAPARVRLLERDGKVHLVFPHLEIPVRLVWARPVSGRGKEIACLDGNGKAVHMLAGPESLDGVSRAVAERELEMRYFLPRIESVPWIKGLFGYWYWRVATDRGPRSFVLKDPRHSIVHVTDDNWVLKDASGGRYEIPSLARLDPRSRARILAIL
jgi:hypothetical protein